MRDVSPLDLVETIREGILVREPDLTVRFASRSFCDTFAVASEQAVGPKVYEIGNGQWDIPTAPHLARDHLSQAAKPSRHLKSSISSRQSADAHDAQRAQGLPAPQQDTTDPQGWLQCQPDNRSKC